MKRAIQILLTVFACVVVTFSSWGLVRAVESNHEAIKAAPVALERACQGLNAAIKASQSPEAVAPANFLIGLILKDATPAQVAEFKRLSEESKNAGVHRVRCDQLVERSFP
jgi:hypothetical protein